jgi:hypothetical protein
MAKRRPRKTKSLMGRFLALFRLSSAAPIEPAPQSRPSGFDPGDTGEAVLKAVLAALCTGKFGCRCVSCSIWHEGFHARQEHWDWIAKRGTISIRTVSPEEHHVLVDFTKRHFAEQAFEHLTGEDLGHG